MTPGDVIRAARNLVSDACEPYRFSDSVMLDFFNMALSEVVAVRPDLGFHVDTVVLAANSVVQKIPTDGFQFVALHSVAGRAVVEVDKETMDREHPDWPSDKEDVPTQFMRNVRNPTSYFIHPKVNFPVNATLEYARCPATYTGLDTQIAELPAVYLQVLTLGTVYYSEIVDDEHASSGRAEQMHAKFMRALENGVVTRRLSQTDDGGLDPRTVI